MKFLIYFLIMSFSPFAFGKLKVVTTLTDLRAITAEVGGDKIEVESIVKGTQDPHYIEAKPSFMTKTSQADLIISIGLDLENAWLPSIIRGSRNPKIAIGKPGYLEVGPLVEPIEIAIEPLTRREGDVHPLGNPHVTLDPIRVGKMAKVIATKLGELDPPNKSFFEKNADAINIRMQTKLKSWKERIDKTGITGIVTYHKTLNYFFDRFQIQNLGMLEPKPGIPPTSGHIIKIIEILKKQKNAFVLIENFFDPSVIKKIKQDVPNLRFAEVAVSVDGAKGVNSMDQLFEHLVSQIERKN